MPILKKIIALTIALAIIFFLYNYNKKHVVVIKGKTMGTTYMVSTWKKKSFNEDLLKDKITTKLLEINDIASTWQKTSEISAFNARKDTNAVKVSPFLAKMVGLSQEISHKSDGYFDITVSPLINLWGFDADGRINKKPSHETISSIQETIGYGKIALQETTQGEILRKRNQTVTINLSAIAKGGGVDSLAELLQSQGFDNYLVEIGGEIIAKGKRADGKLWRVGIEAPQDIGRSIGKTIPLNNASIATSGDYRNYFEQDNIRYSHIINPKTGYPITHKTASVSVVAKSNAVADGWATALLVAGKNKALTLAKEHNLAILVIAKDNDGYFQYYPSQKWLELYPVKTD